MNRILPVLMAALVATAAAQSANQNRTALVPTFQTTTPTGALQPMTINQLTVIDTDVTPMPLEVLSFTIQTGAVVIVKGSQPFHVVSELDIMIFGTLSGDGVGGNSQTAEGGPGGFAGGGFLSAGAGPFPGQPDFAAGGGGGNATAGGNGFNGGAGGGAHVAGPFESLLLGGSGGGGTSDTFGGGGGGVIRLHSNSRIFANGTITARGGPGGDQVGPFPGAKAGAGAGGAIELLAPLVMLSGATLNVLGGLGGGAPSPVGGNGGDGVIVIRTGQLSGAATIVPPAQTFGFGATMTDSNPQARVSIQPAFADFPAAFGAQAFLLFSLAAFPPGQGIPLGGGKELLLDPNAGLFDPTTSPMYPLTAGQGAPIGLSLESTVNIDFTSIVAAVAALGIEDLSIFAQALLIQGSTVFDASEVTTVDFITVGC